MAKKTTMKKMTAISAAVTFVSFIYKLVLSYLTLSQVLLIASISTLMIFIIKLLFVKNVTKSRSEKKKAYLFMTISLLVYSLIFIAFVVLKINGIDISNNKEYSGITGYLFIGFMLLMFILSLTNLKSALEKTDLMVIGLKETTLASALTDTVIIEEFIYRMFFITKNISAINIVHNYFPLAIGVLLLVLSVLMLIRFFRYKA